MGGFDFPTGITKRIEVEGLNDNSLMYYHDQLHVLWKKLEEGYNFDWTFLEIYLLHLRIIREIGRRELKHLAPINKLDFVIAA